MSTVRPGNRSALVVVDVQVGVMAEAWDAARVIARVGAAVQNARDHGVPVVWVQHEGPDLPRDSAAWPWVPGLVPAAGEARVFKCYESSFEETELESVLARAGVTRLVLAGAMSNWCIRATAYAALDRGYDLTLLKDAHTTSAIVLDDGSRVEAASIVTDLNLTMTWLRYPGRDCATSTTEAVDFSTTEVAR